MEMKEKSFDFGNTVYKEGDSDNMFYIVTEGEVEVFIKLTLL